MLVEQLERMETYKIQDLKDAKYWHYNIIPIGLVVLFDCSLEGCENQAMGKY